MEELQAQLENVATKSLHLNETMQDAMTHVAAELQKSLRLNETLRQQHTELQQEHWRKMHAVATKLDASSKLNEKLQRQWEMAVRNAEAQQTMFMQSGRLIELESRLREGETQRALQRDIVTKLTEASIWPATPVPAQAGHDQELEEQFRYSPEQLHAQVCSIILMSN